MTLPEFDFRTGIDGGQLTRLREAAHSIGSFRIRHPLHPAVRCDEALALAQAFFTLPMEEKQRLAIDRSRHFRGFSVMQNERDWREQLHLGREELSRRGPPPYEQLRGPNLWPNENGWKQRMLELITDLECAAKDVLRALALSLGMPDAKFLRESETSYLVLKLIHYQPLSGIEPRLGVAPHVDFSWITLLLQDDTGGLEFGTPDGKWLQVPGVPGTLVVNMGEIMEFATRGYYRATPHRVVNSVQSRISLPFFLNPGLDTRIDPIDFSINAERPRRVAEGEPGTSSHVHRVFSEVRRDPFVYGDEEWKRKGLGIYCQACFHGCSSVRPSR